MTGRAAAPVHPARTHPLARALPSEDGKGADGGSGEHSPARLTGPRLTAELRTLHARLEEAGQRVLRTGDELAVHDLRVAIRRTRTLLEVGREVFGRFHADEVRRALRDLQRATGTLRDEEVLLDIVTSLPLHTSDVSRWVATRRARERRLRAGVRRLVRTGEIERARALLEALLAFPIKRSRDKRLVKFARRAVEHAKREVQRRRSAAHDAQSLHQLRVAYKRLRYTAETFVDVLPLDLGANLVRSAASFQKRIGDVHDVDVVIASVQRARGLHGPSRQALLVALTHLRVERESQLLKELGWGDRRPPASSHSVGTDSLRKISIR